MALQYDGYYDDDFIVNSVEQEDLEQAEADMIELVFQKLGISDPLYGRKLVICGVYKELAAQQLENEGMKEKYDIYSKCWDEVFALADTGAPAGTVYNIELGRG